MPERNNKSLRPLVAGCLLFTFTTPARAQSPSERTAVVVEPKTTSATTPSNGVSPLPDPLTLSVARRFASSHRLEIVAARAQVRATSERPRIVSVLPDPVIFTSIDHVPFMFDGVDASIGVEQSFPLSHVLSNRRRAAEASVGIARAESDRTKLDVELEAADAFLMLLRQRQLIRILADQSALAEQLRATTQARYASGTGTASDLLRAETDVARLQGELQAAGHEEKAKQAMLNTSLGLNAELPVPMLLTVSAQQPTQSWLEVSSRAAHDRPELAAARAQVARSEADVSVMKSMYAPMAMLRTGPAYTMAEGPGWMLMFGVSIPIWRSGLDAGVREANAMVAMGNAELGAMRRMVEGEVADAFHSLESARARLVTLREEVVPRATRAIEATLADYAAGTAPLINVLDAEQALWMVQLELVDAEFNFASRQVLLDRATARMESVE
ncbi:MAG TPA: TolC family protein [Polyangiaceae bacterium]|jgi:outer membrane protein TolC|nr:TolC family protein [Polyangiaceae bacterium]